MFGVPATLLRVGSGLDGLGGNLGRLGPVAGGSSNAVVCAAAHLKGVKAAAYERSGFCWMLFLGRWVRGNPFLFSLPSPALEVSHPIVHLLGFRASPKIPTSDVFLRQASKWSILA